MKKLLAAALVFAAIVQASAQNAVPEFKNKVMLHRKNNTLDNLESTTLTYHIVSKMGGGSVCMRTDGRNASVAYDPKSGDDFIVKIEPGVDPESIVTLYQFDLEKKQRKITTAAVGMSGSKKVEIPVVKLNFKKLEDGVYAISALKPIEPGEYIYTVSQPVSSSVTTDIKGFAFSVAE